MAASVASIDIANFDLHAMYLDGGIEKPIYESTGTGIRSGVMFESRYDVMQFDIDAVIANNFLRQHGYKLKENLTSEAIDGLFTIYFGSHDIDLSDKEYLLQRLYRAITEKREDPAIAMAYQKYRQLIETENLSSTGNLPEFEVDPIAVHALINKFESRSIEEVTALISHAHQNRAFVKRLKTYQRMYNSVAAERKRYLLDLDVNSKCDAVWKVNAYYDDVMMGQIHVFYSRSARTNLGKSFVVMQGILKPPLPHYFVELYPALRGYLPFLNDLLIPAVRSIARSPNVNTDYILVRPVGVQRETLKNRYSFRELLSISDNVKFPCELEINPIAAQRLTILYLPVE